MKSRPTDPILNHKATRNKHIFYFGLKGVGLKVVVHPVKFPDVFLLIRFYGICTS